MRAPTLVLAMVLVAVIALWWPAGAWSQEATAPLGTAELEGYVARVARAWEPYTNAEGIVADPLKAANTGDNYGVIMLADAMLKISARTDDTSLEATGVRILQSALRLPAPSDPFNLLAIASTVHDGEQGDFPPSAWALLRDPLTLLAGQIGQPSGESCLTEPGCYSNWRLVWSAGAALLLADGVAGGPGSLAYERARVEGEIRGDLGLAVAHAGAPLMSNTATTVEAPGEARTGSRRAGVSRADHGAERGKGGTPKDELTTTGLGGVARELSDPGEEPSAYELFSAYMLELIGEADPGAIGSKVARLRGQTDRYALDMMAPDGQLSLAGRSLDQSWVQAAGAALGARRAALEPEAAAAQWSAFAARAMSYLLDAYPLQQDGLLPMVPGLDVLWSPAVVDGYAALNQYDGLTLWLLCDALQRWPSVHGSSATLPADARSLLAGDLASSGLVWGRARGVWWELQGRATSSDPRTAQGLVAVKVRETDSWRDLLALRPIGPGHTSTWVLSLARGGTATPTFYRVRGTGAEATLAGVYRRRPGGRVVARVKWTLRTTALGIRASMSVPKGDALSTTVWLAPGAPRLYAPGAVLTVGACVVSASGRACPVTISWHGRRTATLEVGVGSERAG